MLDHVLSVARLHRQRGLTTVEYAIAGGLVVAGVVILFTVLGTHAEHLLTAINDALAKKP
jgi:Flp pilus assembly pilin Flp